LAAAGWPVVAVEPVGRGFDHLDRLRRIVGDLAATRGRAPELRAIGAEALASVEEFGYAFSINVMEHVDDVAEVLRRTWRALRPGAAYRFVCPNYTFPYEPHFGIPTLGSKALTARVLGARIETSTRVFDPAGTWASLNWITVAGVRRICRQELGVEAEVDRSVFRRFSVRAVSDPAFRQRRGVVTRATMTALDTVGALALLDLLPAGVQPAMSCRIVKPGPS
jgi:SAM-dependent methyltransferase